MTFSDSRISNLLQKDFIVCWESVAPVKMVTFDLGEGRQLKGAISGEIAIYFCTPEGKVFDILPALQSPAVTLNSIKAAHAFYKTHGDKLEAWHVEDLHRKRLYEFAGKKFDKLSAEGKKIFKDPAQIPAYEIYPESKKGEEKRDLYIKAATDSATRDMRAMVFSKMAAAPSYNGLLEDSVITVVEPGGREYYQWQIARCMLDSFDYPVYDKYIAPKPELEIKQTNENSGATISLVKGNPDTELCLNKPKAWKNILFTYILKQELKGGNVKYNSDSLEAIHILEE